MGSWSGAISWFVPATIVLARDSTARAVSSMEGWLCRYPPQLPSEFCAVSNQRRPFASSSFNFGSLKVDEDEHDEDEGEHEGEEQENVSCTARMPARTRAVP